MVKQKEQNKTGLKKFIIVVSLVLIVVQVVLANSLVARGKEIRQLTKEREQLREEISTFENEVAQASSLTTIRRRARELGMEPGKIEFLPPPPLAAAP